MDRQIIKLLVVEESSALRTLLGNILSREPRIQMVGTAQCGRDALAFLSRDDPDVILMDIGLSELDAFETTRRIMETRPIPIVICGSGDNPRETMRTLRAMEAGAVAWVDKPIGKSGKEFDASAAEMLRTIKLMSEVIVVRRWPPGRHKRSSAAAVALPSSRQHADGIEVIGIGASTGGPPVLQSILAGLPKDFTVPVLIVQHISRGFLAGMADWLDQTTALKVHVAAHGMTPLPGHVYLAPDELHMGMGDGKIILSAMEADYGSRPSVAHLFRSLADYGAGAIGVILTGMGKDGARELGRMKALGALTIAQDRESSVVHGMAGEAISLGAASCILPADKIAGALVDAVNSRAALVGAN
ncbi:MAG TPA: chemotaxis protein CheB [Tepidisphaeraceae bacterium]|jgi:two-component system chemotaxis response regulator CheB